MPISRISSSYGYQRVLSGLNLNLARLLQSQEQLSSGLRFQLPSDDPGAARRVLDLDRRLSGARRAQDALAAGQASLGEGASRLQEASGLIAEAREHIIQAMNGVLDPDSRGLIGGELRSIREALLDLANSKIDGNALFAGSKTGSQPFVEVTENGKKRVVYQGDTEAQTIEVGGNKTAVNLSGLDVFASFAPSGVTLEGPTGIALGSTANQGTGSQELVIRQDGTDAGNLTSVGIALSGALGNTIVGAHAIEIDAATGTVRLGDGEAVKLPDPSSAEASDFVVTGADGAQVHLNVSGWDGNSYSGSLTGSASISFAGSDFQALDLSATDQRLIAPGGAQVIHVDATQVSRAGHELVHFTGAENLFDLLEGLGEDLEAAEDFTSGEIYDRLALRLTELDRHMKAVGNGLGTLGARTQRLADSQDSYLSVELGLQARLSDVQDADLSEVVLDLQRSQSALQLSQATGARLLQSSLLDYLR